MTAASTKKPNVDKLDKKKLREMASDLGVAWDKRIDSEDDLKKKIKAALNKAGDLEEATGTDFDVTKRSPVTTIIDPFTKKEVKQPTACFGWFYAPIYDPENKAMVKLCTTECVHAKFCKPLTEVSAKALEKLDAEAEVEKEVEAMDDSDLQLAEAATKSKKGKTKKKGDDDSLSKHQDVKSTGAIDDSTEFEVIFDLEFALAVDDDDFRKFFKRVAKKYPMGTTVEAKDIASIFCTVLSLEDTDEGRQEVYDDVFPQMIQDEYFKRA